MAVLATEHENEFCWDLWRPWSPYTLANQRPSIDEVSGPDTFNLAPWAAEPRNEPDYSKHPNQYPAVTRNMGLPPMYRGGVGSSGPQP